MPTPVPTLFTKNPSQVPTSAPSRVPTSPPTDPPSGYPSPGPTRHPTPAGDTLVKVGGSLTLASFTAAMKDDADMESAIKTAIAGAVTGASAADVTITCFDTAAVCNGRRRLAADRRRLQERGVQRRRHLGLHVAPVVEGGCAGVGPRRRRPCSGRRPTPA